MTSSTPVASPPNRPTEKTYRACFMVGCSGKHHSKGFCKKHYRRLVKYGDPEQYTYLKNDKVKAPKMCVVEGCGEPHQAAGLCIKHYRRFKRDGTTGIKIRVLAPIVTNQIEIEGNVCRILLNDASGEIRAKATIDKDDIEKAKQYRWRLWRDGRTQYVIGRKLSEGRGKDYKLHRVIMDIPAGPIVVDHINHDTLDNRRANLRSCTCQQNAWNTISKGRSNKPNGHKGVYYCEGKGWRSRIYLNQKQIHLGYYESDTEAAIAYNKAALKYFGKFASLNEVFQEGGAS